MNNQPSFKINISCLLRENMEQTENASQMNERRFKYPEQVFNPVKTIPLVHTYKSD